MFLGSLRLKVWAMRCMLFMRVKAFMISEGQRKKIFSKWLHMYKANW